MSAGANWVTSPLYTNRARQDRSSFSLPLRAVIYLWVCDRTLDIMSLVYSVRLEDGSVTNLKTRRWKY